MKIRVGALIRTIQRVSEMSSTLEELGISVEIGCDFSRYRVLRCAEDSRSAIYPMFDVSSSYIDESNGLWICGFDAAGTLIHTQAVRLLDLSDISLANHLRSHRHKYITPDTTPDPDGTFYSGPGALEIVTGRVCYHGEFWLMARGLGGPRSLGATQILSRMLIELISGVWDPDYVFAFVPKRLAEKGTHLRYGYSHCEIGAWMGPDMQITEEDYLIWMSRDEIKRLQARPRWNSFEKNSDEQRSQIRAAQTHEDRPTVAASGLARRDHGSNG